MTLLRFDPAGSIDTEGGITRQQLRDLAGPLERLRCDLLGSARQPQDVGQPEAVSESLGTGFLSLPEAQLEAYQQTRERSELGRIFQIANGMHDQIDAVVVLAAGAPSMAARAIMDACCDPYHNELTRAARGSKPRMYFGGNHFDNDASAALLNRLAAGGYGGTRAEKRFAIVVVSTHGDAIETAVALRHCHAILESSLGIDDRDLLRRLVIPVIGSDGSLSGLADPLDCDRGLSIPKGVEGWFSVLSPAVLLPAAMLGLDCIRLLEGAADMNQHFRDASYEDNVVLQYVAVNQQLAQRRDKSIRVMSVWSKALESVGLWYDQLLAASVGTRPLGVTPLTAVNAQNGLGRSQQHRLGRNDKVLNRLIVESCRSDPLAVSASDQDRDGRSDDGRSDMADRTLPEVMASALQSADDSLAASGRPWTDIVLPGIDTHVLGQLFQMLMIATLLETRLPGIDSSGQTGAGPRECDLQEQLGPGTPA